MTLCNRAFNNLLLLEASLLADNWSGRLSHSLLRESNRSYLENNEGPVLTSDEVPQQQTVNSLTDSF